MMQNSRHYNKAPIDEAILDLRVTVPDGVTASTFASLRDVIGDRFPVMEELYAHAGALMFHGGEATHQGTSQLSGYVFRGSDRRHVFQATTTGFTYNQLAPYETWEGFRDQARNLWDIYRSACNPTNVTRAGIRYVNRLEFESASIDLDEYLRTAPRIAAGLSQSLSGYFMQLQIPQDDINAMLILTEALAQPRKPGYVTVMLDIDLFRMHTWMPGEEELWQFLEVLRVRKNKVFEASLTDQAKEMFS